MVECSTTQVFFFVISPTVQTSGGGGAGWKRMFIVHKPWRTIFLKLWWEHMSVLGQAWSHQATSQRRWGRQVNKPCSLEDPHLDPSGYKLIWRIRIRPLVFAEKCYHNVKGSHTKSDAEDKLYFWTYLFKFPQKLIIRFWSVWAQQNLFVRL